MFVIKYDKVSMIRLVRCIEKYPALYDGRRHYSKEEQDSAWDKVAMEVGEKDSLCRDRWHSIKSCYIRHLKYSALNSKRRPYYLADYLDFMLPHVSDRIKSFLASKQFEIDRLPSYLKEALPKPVASVSYVRYLKHPVPEPESVTADDDVDSNGQNNFIKEEIVDVEEVSDSDWSSATPEIMQQPSSSKGSAKRLPTKSVTNGSSSKKIKTLKVNDPCKINNSEDEDVKFLKSLLPEISRMSSHQKLKFKQEALGIIEDILYASEDAEDLNITD